MVTDSQRNVLIICTVDADKLKWSINQFNFLTWRQV